MLKQLTLRALLKAQDSTQRNDKPFTSNESPGVCFYMQNTAEQDSPELEFPVIGCTWSQHSLVIDKTTTPQLPVFISQLQRDVHSNTISLTVIVTRGTRSASTVKIMLTDTFPTVFILHQSHYVGRSSPFTFHKEFKTTAINIFVIYYMNNINNT